jgi:Protein of unknown function (DUF2510)
MRRADAPRAGWYPDPESRTNLRWWDGLDWTDVRRAPPSSAELSAAQDQARFRAAANDFAPGATRAAAAAASAAATQADQVANEVRAATRSEMQRAADLFNQRAQAARENWTPLISEYTNKAKRWLRRLIVIAVLVFVVWLAWQIFAQASLLDWIGDRIDNLTNDENAALALMNSVS